MDEYLPEFPTPFINPPPVKGVHWNFCNGGRVRKISDTLPERQKVRRYLFVLTKYRHWSIWSDRRTNRQTTGKTILLSSRRVLLTRDNKTDRPRLSNYDQCVREFTRLPAFDQGLTHLPRFAVNN